MAGKVALMTLLTQVMSFGLSKQTTCEIRYDQRLKGLVADCSRRNLTSVPRDLPVNIVALSLDYNFIRKIHNWTFTRFNNLRTLSLKKNFIEAFDKDAFYGLHHLVELNLRRTRYLDNGSYPRGLFDPIRNLTSFYLGGEARSGFAFPSYIFLNLSKLVTLWIEESWPGSHQGNDFSNLGSLESLTVISHSVDILKNSTFLYLESVPVKKLTIIAKLDKMDECLFCSFKNLTYLKISVLWQSKITLKAITQSFYGLVNRHSSIEEIDLRDIQHKNTIIDRQMMGYLLHLCVKRLDLSSNRLMGIKADTFQANDTFTTCIEHLKLSKNYIQSGMNSLPQFLHMINLKSIDIAQNVDKESLYSLKSYSVENGIHMLPVKRMNGFQIPVPPKIEYANASCVGSHLSFRVDVNFTGANNLRTLDISYNGAFDSPAKVYGLSSITYLDISGMNVEKSALTNTDMFIGLKTLIARDTDTFPSLLMSKDSVFFILMQPLRYLDLSGNGLQVIAKSTFSRLVNVHTLCFSRNRLSYVPPEVLYMPSLTSLDLSFNSITTIRQQERNLLDEKRQQQHDFSLNIHGNTILCTCGTLNFIKWLHETRITLKGNGNYSCLTEYGTMTFTTQIYNNFLLHFRRCVGQFWLTVAVFLQCFLIICLLSAFLLKKYYPKIEHEVLRWLGLLESKRWDYEYDAYVCYANKDYKWPCHCLFKKLMKRDETVKLYLPDLHDPFGEVKAEVIHVAIENCWKLIIVVTEDLFMDEWSYFKVLEALRLFSQEGIITSRILLLYQDISSKAKARVPKVLLNVVPRKNILRVNSGNDFWTKLHQKIISEDMDVDVLF